MKTYHGAHETTIYDLNEYRRRSDEISQRYDKISERAKRVRNYIGIAGLTTIATSLLLHYAVNQPNIARYALGAGAALIFVAVATEAVIYNIGRIRMKKEIDELFKNPPKKRIY